VKKDKTVKTETKSQNENENEYQLCLSKEND